LALPETAFQPISVAAGLWLTTKVAKLKMLMTPEAVEVEPKKSMKLLKRRRHELYSTF
jgi:hypothetical protein